MNILITGGTGYIGSHLKDFFSKNGDKVSVFTRSKDTDNRTTFHWDPSSRVVPLEPLENADVVIHLSGASVMGKRWTSSYKQEILKSRVKSTTVLSETLAELSSPPEIFISCSALGFYGDRGQDLVDENSGAGEGFLADVCCSWEAATHTATKAGIRVVTARLGMVLSRDGGALGRMLLPFRLGLGGRLGSGNQYVSWISMDDVLSGIKHCIETESVVGPVNFVAPKPVTNLEFTHSLGLALHRPTLFPFPAFLARLVFGQVADELILSSTRVNPCRLLESGYHFQHYEIQPTLLELLG